MPSLQCKQSIHHFILHIKDQHLCMNAKMHKVRGVLLPPSFYSSEDVVYLAKALIGKVIVSLIDGEYCSGRIVETEAYRAPEDKACHAWNNRRTHRTQTMFEAGGVAYIYLCYGIHHLFNVVTGPKDMAHAVLVRAVEPLDNISLMLQRRKMRTLQPNLTNGPGKWTQALGITTALNGIKLYTPDAIIQLRDDGYEVDESQLLSGPRIGVQYAAEWANVPWRFRLAQNAYIGP